MNNKIKQMKFVLLTVSLAVIACTLIGVYLFSNVSKEESALALETATPTDADVDSSIITFKAQNSDNKDYTGVVYKIYRDNGYMNEVASFVLSWNGKSYIDSNGTPLVFKGPEELNMAGGNAYLHCEKLEIGSYFYRAEENLWKSGDTVSSIGLKWKENLEKFEVKSGWDSANNPLEIRVGLEALPTEATTNEAVEIIAAPDETSEVASEETVSATPTDAAEVSTEVTTEATEATEATETEVATPADATPTDATGDIHFTSTVSFVKKFAARALSLRASSSYSVYRTQQSLETPPHMLRNPAGNDMFSVYCGDHNKSAAPTTGISVTLHTYGTDNANSLAKLGNNDVVKSLYYGFKDKVRWTSIRQNLDYYRWGTAHGYAGPAFSVAGKDMPTDQYKADVQLGTVSIKEKTVTYTRGTETKTDIGTDSTRYKHTYTISKNLKAETEVGVYDFNYSYSSNKFTSNENARLRRTNIYKVKTDANSYTFKVPKKVTCYTTTDKAEKEGITGCKWKSYTAGEEVSLTDGTYFMFVAAKTYAGTSSVNATAAKDGFVAYWAEPGDSVYQNFFGAELYEYKLSIVIDWEKEEESGSGRFELSKKPAVGTDSWDYSQYNMAGIRYVIYSDAACTTTAMSSAHKRGDGIPVGQSTQIVLSYNGKAYMDENGKNVIFVSKAAKDAYKEKYDLYTYRWYKDDLEQGKSYTYYYKEAGILSGGNGNAYYYDDGKSVTKALINKHSGKDISVTNFKLDTKKHKFTFKAGDSISDVTEETTDNWDSAKTKVTKSYSGSVKELAGVKFNLYKVSGNGSAYSNDNLVADFIHNGTKVVPNKVNPNKKQELNIGIKIGTGADADYFTNIPYGWYCLVEDTATATERGFAPAAPVYLQCSASNKTLNFTMTNERSGLMLKKQFENTPMNRLCSYSLEGAEYKVYITSGNGVESTSNYVCTFTTDKSGNGYVTDYNRSKYYALSNVKDGHAYKLVGVPINSWVYIKETKASAGCELDTKSYFLHFTANNLSQTVTSIEPLKNDPIRIQIQKEDSTSGSNAGAASLAGAEFTVKYYDVNVSGNVDKGAVYQSIKEMSPTRTWVFQSDKDGLVDMYDSSYLVAEKSDELYYTANMGKPTFPYGAVTIEETKAPDGYTRTGVFTTTDGTDKSNEDGVIFTIINADYTTENFIGTNSLIKKEEVLRGDIKFKKIALDTDKPLSGIAFKITSKTTGESHVVVTDADGMIDTSKIKHSENTNAADADNGTVSGMWFYGNENCEGTVDDTLGALPFDTYEITELATDINKDYRLITPITVDLTKETDYTDGYQLYDLGTVTNIPEPYLHTRALGVKTQDNIIPANEKVDIEDIADYYYLEAGNTYTLKGIIMDPETGKVYAQPDGTYSTGVQTFEVPDNETGYASASVRIPFVLDTTGLDAKDVVVAEYLFEGEDTSELVVNEDGTVDETNVYKTHTGKLVKHDDLTAKSQTLSIPKIETTALGVESESHYLLNSGIIKFRDEVRYENAIPEKTYDLLADVMNQETGKPLLDVDGNKVVATASFTPTEKNGTAYVKFTVDASKVDFRDKAIVLFETLSYNKITLAVHADISDTDQQLYFPGVSSVLSESKTGEHKALYGKSMNLTDTLNLTRIPVNEELTIKEVLVNSRTGKVLKADGKEIASEKKQSFESSTASIKISFSFDGTKTDLLAKDETLAKVVAFVYVYDSKGHLIASEEDLKNQDQTVTPYTEYTKISVKKVWDDNEDQDGIRPSTVDVCLLADGKQVGRTVELSENNGWEYTWENLARQKNGKDIVYTVDEVKIPDGYTKTITNKGTAFTITNSHKPGITEVKVTKVWEDSNDKYQKRPDGIKVQLYKGEGEHLEAIGEPVTLNEKCDWKYTWSDLARQEAGEDVTYTVDEVTVPDGYVKTVEKEGDSEVTSLIITNRMPDTPKTGDEFPLIPVVISMFVSLVAVLFIFIRKRRKK